MAATTEELEDCPTEESSVCMVCPYCLHGYNVSENRPKILSCNHTMCIICVKSMGEEFECPVCQQVVTINTLPLPTNFQILKLLEDPKVDEENAVVESYISKTPGQLLVDGYECCCQKLVNIELEQAMLQSAREYNLEKVDRDFENLVTIINRRRKLLKAQLQDVYQKKEEEIQDLQEAASLNLMCVKKLEGTVKSLPSSAKTTAILQGEISELEESINKIHCGKNLIEFQTDEEHLAAFRKYVTEFGSLKHDQAFPIRSVWLKGPEFVGGKIMGNCNILSADFELTSTAKLKIVFKNLSTDESIGSMLESNAEGQVDFEVEMSEAGMYEVYFEYDDLPLTGGAVVQVPDCSNSSGSGEVTSTVRPSTSQSSDDTIVSSTNEEDDVKSSQETPAV